jgi:purine nucleoside phosphorylase
MAVTVAQIETAYEKLITLIPKGFRPKVAIIGGSGLAALEKAIEGERMEVGYEKIPGFPVSTG